jgi:hypothetical protein
MDTELIAQCLLDIVHEAAASDVERWAQFGRDCLQDLYGPDWQQKLDDRHNNRAASQHKGCRARAATWHRCGGRSCSVCAHTRAVTIDKTRVNSRTVQNSSPAAAIWRTTSRSS